ncbi:G-type lectin S-receptor-like serine/threonine-protein kinase SD2-5 [Coffea arabica]|uniref:G-type lectin S-receptor-like serine/threonine-protein kinase SD2-5 n=1 Tax=Coffea arabica TaxID=13443 RepID=A0ABM4UF26_COFAR
MLISRKEEKVEDSIKPPRQPEGEKDSSIQMPGLPMRFSYEELRVAPSNFEEKLGGGGFGSVFKGRLQDGTSVAVKHLEKPSLDMKGFLAEVKTIGSIHHFNLVKLIGYCKDKSHQLRIRKRIAIDVAKGLAYLHEECSQKVVHLDVKPQKLLLDENFNGKVSDFGLSKLIDRDKSQVVTTIKGNPGYIAPERRFTTEKVDIYSFGIGLLEIISGRRNVDNHSESCSHPLNLLQWKSKENKLLDIVRNFDQDMKNNAEEVERMIRIAARCLQDDHTRRPCMSTVVNVLEGAMEVELKHQLQLHTCVGRSCCEH